ncbi:MAG: MAPEG family protein [Wenzhouxiangella sp.]
MSTSALVLTLFIGWTLALVIVMEVIRSYLTLSGQRSVDGFSPDNAGLSPFMQRLARVHANCIEGLPIFGGLLIVALITDQAVITDPLAPILIIARLIQSMIHLGSISPLAIYLRFTAFSVQLIIAAWWAFGLLRVAF